MSRSMPASLVSAPSGSSSSTALPPPVPSFPQPRYHSSRANLRVNTDFGRHRSNSQAPPPPPPLNLEYATSHQFSRSMSHASPLSPLRDGDSLGSSTPDRNRDVMMAVQGLRAVGFDSPASSPVGTTHKPSSEVEAGPSKGEVTMKRIREALERSADEGDTLDLSRRGIEMIGVEAVEMFRCGVGKEGKGVWRLALSYNILRDGCIDDSFSRLSRLRYLNLKGNSLTEFPPALTDMPSLEILDLSKNKLTSFPERPGRLNKLKVLSLTSNRLYSLPSYLTEFTVLKVFKVDSNPVEWPPREVLGALIENEKSGDATSVKSGKSRKEEDLRPWIENMKSWMRQRAAETDRLLERSKQEQDGYLASEEEPSSAFSVDEPVSAGPWSHQSSSSLAGMASMSSQNTIRPWREESTRSPSPGPIIATSAAPLPSPSIMARGRPPLGQRNRSATLSSDSLARVSSTLASSVTSSSRHERTASSSTTPPVSASTASSHSRTASANLPLPPPPPIPAVHHNRGASFTATQRLSANLSAKKSLPDLRQSHAKIIQERRDPGTPTEEVRALGMGIKSPVRTAVNSPAWAAKITESPSASCPIRRNGSSDMLRSASHLPGGRGTSPSREGLSDESRNSYFRRLSTLPISTISKTIPPALLKFMDAIRGILFALSQLHSALKQYLVFAVSDSVAGVFTRVMDPAGRYMNTLINALDRFDSMSRRNNPPVSAIRAVVDATRDSITVFTKVVAVLKLQMPALKTCDHRYTRTLLLMIYGSMTEIATSWTGVAPLLVEIRPLLAADTALVNRALGGTKMVTSASFTGRTPISPILERGESLSPPSVPRSGTTIGNSPLHQVVNESPIPTRTARVEARSRRQGGSFSTQDVERGMLMGSPGLSREDNVSGSGYTRHKPSASASVVLHDQAEESETEEETLASVPPFPIKSGSGSSNVPITPPELAQAAVPVTLVPSHSEFTRAGHKPSSSSGSSHALSMSVSSVAHVPPKKLSVDIRPATPASAVPFDEDLLDVIDTATDIAFTVWLKLAEDINSTGILSGGHAKSSSQSSVSSSLSGAPFTPIGTSRPTGISARHHSELCHLLSVSEQITATLRESLMGLRADPLSLSHTTLSEDAQAFIKTVVRVSELVKVISFNHTFPSSVRQSLSRLTQATRECAILMQVSSLRPGTATPALPMFARPSVAPNYARSGHHGAASSVEDLTTTPNAAMYGGGPAGGWSQPTGLRGLQLASKHSALARNRSATNILPPTPSSAMEGDRGEAVYGRGAPRSAQSSQVAF